MPPAIGLVAAAAGTIVGASIPGILGAIGAALTTAAIPYVAGAGRLVPRQEGPPCRS
jgi:hypothetical protein